MMEQKKKGFTLIELLATIVIITLVFSLGFVFIFNLLDNSERISKEVSEKLILDATEQYVIEYSNTNDWKYEEDDNGAKTSCITIDSLINHGYFKGDEEKIIEYKDNYFVKVTMINGVSNYEIIEISKIGEHCQYYNRETIVDK